jgi:hypothetical protein
MNHMAPATIPLKSGTPLTQILGYGKYNRRETSLLAYPKAFTSRQQEQVNHIEGGS